MQETVYNKIGKGYNTTRKADPYITERLLALLDAQKGGNYLDIGCGTGNYTIKLAEFGLNMTGADPSEVMLAEARDKNSSVTWVQGTAEQIPLPENSVDGIVATLTVHHWNDHGKAFSELARVLKPAGRLVFFTFTPEQEAGYWFNHFFPEMMKKGMKRSLTLDQTNSLAETAGLEVMLTEKYFVQGDLQDMFGYSGKNDPERYFDPEIIKGISYFSIYATDTELDEGLKKLRKCLDNGEFEAVKMQYDKGAGDYLFVVMRKY